MACEAEEPKTMTTPYPGNIFKACAREHMYWERHALEAMWDAVQSVFWMLRAIEKGWFNEGQSGARGAVYLSKEVFRHEQRAIECMKRVGTPACDHVWMSAGEGYFQYWQWCMRCGAIDVNGEMALPDPDVASEDKVRWM